MTGRSRRPLPDVGPTLSTDPNGQRGLLASADAAALAAAQELALPSLGTPAQQASDYAQRNGGTLMTCDCAAGSLEATVQVRVAVAHLFLVPGALTIEATARAVIDLPAA